MIKKIFKRLWRPLAIGAFLAIGINCVTHVTTFGQEDNVFNFTQAQSQLENYRFNPDAFEEYVPLEEQARVLENLGIPVSEEILKETQEWLEKNPDAREWTEGYPYYSLLTSVGAPDYTEENYEAIPVSNKVYWFDFEGWGLDRDYTDILKGLEAIGNGELKITDMRTDVSGVNWEDGTGKLRITYSLNGTGYEYMAAVYYDWLDAGFLDSVNKALEAEGIKKRIYGMGDNGQGCILFFNDKEWAELFYKETGCQLSASFK